MKNLKKVEKRYLKRIDECYSTQGYKKLWAYFLDITKKDYFQKVIKDIRKNFKMPLKGFKPIKVRNKIYYHYPPKKWEYCHNYEATKKINRALESICNKYNLHHMDWYETIEHYLFYNKIRPIYHLNSSNLCLIQDLIEEKKEAELERKEGVYNGFFEKSDNFFFPITIRINPYASQRDIIDYIKRMYPTIKELQQKYIKKEVKIGKVRSKNKAIQKRNDFIYKHKSKSLKEIRKLLAKKKIFLDDGHIAKIIYLEKYKRKEV